MNFFGKRKVVLVLALILFSYTSDVLAQEQECSSTDTTKTIDVNQMVNTLVNRIKLSGYAHVGFNYNSQESPRDEFKIARIIFMADARINKQFNMYFMFDFKSASLHELYLNYTASPYFNVRMGQFKTPFSIENPMSPTVLELIPCTSLVAGYMIGGSDALMMKGSSGRDMGLNVYGSFLKKKLDYSLAIMNGQGRNNSDANSQKDFVATVAAHPLRWLTLSTSMILGTGNIAVSPLLRHPSQYFCSLAPGITGFKGNGNYTRNRYAAGFSIDTKRLGVRSEYMQGKDADFVSKGYYATACLKRIATNLDLIGSYDWLRIYSGKHNRYLGGLQYWFYPRCRFQLSYDYETADACRCQNAVQAQVQVRF